MTPLNAIVTKDLSVIIVRKVGCQLYSGRFFSFQLFHDGHVYAIATNVDIAPESVEQLLLYDLFTADLFPVVLPKNNTFFSEGRPEISLLFAG